MPLDSESCYRALATHDRRFDGRFFVGVRTTGVYCRPVCGARLPRRENCRFFTSAAAAEAGGYRPCLRCRPELAPGLASVDASAQFAQAAVRLIEEGVLEHGGVDALAARIGVTSRHLRRIFDAEFGVSPVEYAQTQRLLLAKRLLTDTSLPVLDVAYASGFKSLRRFNALFSTRYRMAPSHLRRATAPAAAPGVLRFELAYRPPFAWDALLAFLAARAIPGVEHVERGRYLRTLAIAHRGQRAAGHIAVAHARRRSAVQLEVSPDLACVVPAVIGRVRQAFDLGCDPAPIAARLGDLAQTMPGLRVPGTCDGFEVAARAVIGQQISVAAARTLLGRLAAAFGEPLAGDVPRAIMHVFPAPAAIAARPIAELRAIGLPASRAQTLADLARSVASGTIALVPGAGVERTMAALESIRGIGRWTSSYIAMRALGWPDAFLESDLGVLKALGETSAAQARRRSEAWRPWRAYAVIHLWSRHA
ncbi:MAG: DNA-3-methyladenine glycosylase 2 [Proteobacteria bacterium]|nr:DNA-3-methyladenine glycosylase 2 [Pseudomonadota bacterium]